MDLKAGMKLRSAVCNTEVIVVRPPSMPVELCCGGVAMLAATESRGEATVDPDHGAGTQLGKRYADPTSGLEILCTKAGDGSLALGGQPLLVKEAKPLPSSD